MSVSVNVCLWVLPCNGMATCLMCTLPLTQPPVVLREEQLYVMNGIIEPLKSCVVYIHVYLCSLLLLLFLRGFLYLMHQLLISRIVWNQQQDVETRNRGYFATALVDSATCGQKIHRLPLAVATIGTDGIITTQKQRFFFCPIISELNYNQHLPTMFVTCPSHIFTHKDRFSDHLCLLCYFQIWSDIFFQLSVTCQQHKLQCGGNRHKIFWDFRDLISLSQKNKMLNFLQVSAKTSELCSVSQSIFKSSACRPPSAVGVTTPTLPSSPCLLGPGLV